MATPKCEVRSYLKVPFRVAVSKEAGKLQGKALVRVEAPAAADSRTPIDLVVVRDVSTGAGDGLLAGDNTAVARMTTTTTEKPSSMMDLVGKALTFIKTHLEDGSDRCSIVCSNKHVDSRCTAHDIKVSGEEVHQIDIVGHMGSRSDLEHAMKLLDERPDKTRQGFVILLSDGLAGNRSESSSQGSHDDDVHRLLGVLTTRKYIYPVHTFGLGKAHDPKILHSIAKETNGTYSSITEDLDSKTMEALAVCLAGLKSVVAVDMRVEIKPPVVEPAAAAASKGKETAAAAAPAATGIITATGFQEGIKDCRAAKEEGSHNVINLGVLYAGEVKEFIVDIEINSCTVTSAGYYTVGLYTVTGTYKDAQQTIKQWTCTREEAGVWAYKKGRADKLTDFTPFPMVLQQMFRFKVLEFMHEFEKQLDAMNENPDISSLISMMAEKDNCIIGQGEGERHHPILQKMAAKELEEMWDKFKRNDSRELAEEARSIGLDLVGLFDDDIGAMVSCLRRGSGLGCVYSWVLSHEMQQACFTGLPTPTAFLTPAMKKMVKEAQEQSAGKDDARTSSSAAGNKRPTLPPPPPPPPGGEEGYMYMCELLQKMCNSLEGIGSKLEQSNAHFRNAVAIVMPLTTNPPPAGNGEQRPN